jgi:PAS domain S-box-containing protein
LYRVTAITIALFVTALVAVGFAVLSWRRRDDEPGATALTVYLLSIAGGAATYGLDIAAVTLPTKLFWAEVSLVFMGAVGASWAYFALAYTGRSDWTTRRVAATLALEPFGLVVLFAVFGRDPLVYTLPDSGGVGSMSAVGAEAGPVVIAHFLYIIVVSLVATILFVDLYVRARSLYRTQALAVLVGAVSPWAGVAVRAIGIAGEVDVTLFVWAFAGVVMALALNRFRVLDPVPAAHSTVVEEMGDGILVLDRDDVVGDVNPTARDLLSIDADVVGQRAESVLDDWDRLADAPPDAWTETAVQDGDETRYLELQVSPFFDHHGRRVGRLVVLRDVTDRKRREQTLARFKTVFESVQDRVFVLDEADRFVLANDRLAALLDYERSDLLGRSFATVLADGTAGDVLDVTDDAVEVTVRTQTGEDIPCELLLAPVAFDGERGTVGVLRDIRERKRVERSLQETTERFETLVAASPIAIVAADTDGVVEVWNPAAEELFGYDAAEAVGEFMPIIPEENRDAIFEQHERILAGERLTGLETELERADGTLVETSVSIAPTHGPSGEVTGSVAVIADISDRKERERKLERQNERLDEFASIVSHDLRNPLQVATGHLELLAESTDDPSVEHVETALERMVTLIDDLLTLAREGRDVSDPEPVDLEAVATRSWGTVATDVASLEVIDVPETVQGDESRLQELFENLFRNCVEHGASPDHSVTVRLGSLDGGGFFVADDGPGIPEDERETVFESGYTTAEDGTGFGLAIVERIANAHGWDVAVTESENGGARFEFVPEESRPHRADPEPNA